MKSLIWKEWRETRWIAISFLVICLLTSIRWKIAHPGDENSWHAGIWSLLIVFLGARAFAGEKQATTMEFLAAQPLRKTHLWALKAAWGFGLCLVVFVISGIFDYLLMRADPFYVALHLLGAPLSWVFLALLAIHAVALLASVVCDKTVVAIGFSFVIWAAVGCVIALIDRFNPFFYQFFNTRWGFPLGALWFSLVFLAGSFLIVAWREVWPNYPAAVKRGAIGVGVGTVIVLLILSSANVPPGKITRIAELNANRTGVVFSVEVGGKRLSGWGIDIDGENFTKPVNQLLPQRRHPAFAREGAKALHNELVIMPVRRGENAGGYVIEKLEHDRLIPRRVRRTIQPVAGASLSWLGAWDQIDTATGVFDQFYFVEELPSGERYLRARFFEGEQAGLTGRIGRLIAVSPERESFIFVQPGGEVGEGKVRLTLSSWHEEPSRFYSVEVDPEILDSLSFVTEDVVQYERAGTMYLTDPSGLHDVEPGPPPELRVPGITPIRIPWESPDRLKVPPSIVARGPDYLRRVAENLHENRFRRTFIGFRKAEEAIALLSGEARTELPESFVEVITHDARALELLEDLAAELGAELPEELFGEAIFLVPRGKQIIYLRKEDEQRTSLWTLDIESGESTKILDDIDVTSPAVPKALVAPIMDDHFAFVRDAKTIWTYRDGDLKQIFPPS
jgi:hypothetical protein